MPIHIRSTSNIDGNSPRRYANRVPSHNLPTGVDCVRPNIEGYSHVGNIPVSLRPLRNAAKSCASSLGALVLRKPITGIVVCCARAAIGHAAAMPTITLIKSRRRIASRKTREPTRNSSEPSERLQHDFLENGTGAERPYFAGAPNVPSGSTLCHQAVEYLTRIPPEGALDAIQAVITDGLPAVEATCDGMCPFASVLPRPPVGG